MRRIAASLTLLSAFCATAARGEPATPQGAKQMLDGYVAIFGQGVVDNGILTIEPRGDSYEVTWHIRRAIEPSAQFQMGDFGYEVTPGLNGAWRVSADAFPSFGFSTVTNSGRLSGKIDVIGMNVDGSFDPNLPIPFTSRSKFGDIIGDFRIFQAGKLIPFHVDESNIQVDLKQTTTPVGANFALHQSAQSVVEHVTLPFGPQPNAKLDMTLKVGAVSVDGTIDQLRTAQVVALWRDFLAHKDEPRDDARAGAVRSILSAGLPGWDRVSLAADVADVAFDMSLAQAHLNALHETFVLPGFTDGATGAIGLKLDQFDVHSPLLPQGFESLLPLSLSLDVAMKVGVLDKIARIALADHDFSLDRGVSSDGQAKIEQTFRNSELTFTLAPGYLRVPLVDLAYQGDVRAIPGRYFKAHVVVSVDTLDKVLALVKPFAVISPELAKAVLAVSVAKGMAKTGADGRLVWEIDAAGPPSQLTINGLPIPIGD